MQEGDSIRDAIEAVPTVQPCIIVHGNLLSMKEGILVVEKKTVTTFPQKQALLILLSSFYVNNMHYTEGCKNFFTFLEVVLLKHKKPTKKTRLSAVIAKLTS